VAYVQSRVDTSEAYDDLRDLLAEVKGLGREEERLAHKALEGRP